MFSFYFFFLLRVQFGGREEQFFVWYCQTSLFLFFAATECERPTKAPKNGTLGTCEDNTAKIIFDDHTTECGFECVTGYELTNINKFACTQDGKLSPDPKDVLCKGTS